MPGVSHIGATLIGSPCVAHLNGVDAMLAHVKLLLSEFSFVFVRDFRSDLRSRVLRVVLRLASQRKERHGDLRDISPLKQVARLENLLIGNTVSPDPLLESGHVFHEGEVARALLGRPLDGSWRQLVDEFAQNQSIPQKVLVRLFGRLDFARQLRDPIQHLLLQLGIATRHCC